MSDTVLRYEAAGGVGRITLSRPAQGNRMDLHAYQAVSAALVRAGDDPEAQVILLTAEGPDFSLGEDMDYLARLERDGRFAEWSRGYGGWIEQVWHNPKILVAQVRGRALGIGCELALLADVTFAGRGASFGHPETHLGIVSHTVWPWLVGPKLAKEYLATGRLMPAEVAHRAGLINAAVDEDALEGHVAAFLQDLVTMPAGTPGANKKRINWAFRDISRLLHDDRRYDVDFDWLVSSRDVDYEFYRSVAREGVGAAIRNRDSQYS